MNSPSRDSDHVERLFRRLVANLAALDAGALYRPVPVNEIHERLVPYRTHRAALGVDTSEDYEFIVLRLLAGVGGFAQTFPEEVRVALEREVTSVNPETALYRQFADATFLLDPDKVRRALGEAGERRRADASEGDRTRAEATPGEKWRAESGEARRPAPVDPDDAASPPFMLVEPEDDDPDEDERAVLPRAFATGAPCQYCGSGLPVGRTVLFCPHCGQNVGVVHCPTCGSDLDVGWQFCITCGEKVTGL